MDKKYSIAEAKNRLTKLVHSAEQGTPVELTRHGKSVAVLVSLADYRRLAGGRRDFWQACEAFREREQVAKLAIDPALFEDARDNSPGREVEL